MDVTDIGGIQLESQHGRTTGVDIRVYNWLEQWLAEDEARRLVHSLAWDRLIQLVCAYHRAIAETRVWG